MHILHISWRIRKKILGEKTLVMSYRKVEKKENGEKKYICQEERHKTARFPEAFKRDGRFRSRNDLPFYTSISCVILWGKFCNVIYSYFTCMILEHLFPLMFIMNILFFDGVIFTSLALFLPLCMCGPFTGIFRTSVYIKRQL